ncbi:MAG TPA: hypothetical protein VFT31_15410 [Kribbella sp.]|nr:hypothetical protein [Kribbella sp.]
MFDGVVPADPRGNTPGVHSQFSLTAERLAWPVGPDLGEAEHDGMQVHPDTGVIAALRGTDDVLRLVAEGLPERLVAVGRPANLAVTEGVNKA